MPPRVIQVAPDMLTIDGRRYQIVYDYKDAVDRETINTRYDDILAKYDYIVGDWGYDQLRLRGFYNDDNNQAASDQIISHLEDYLYEYCNFGCAYFVLQRLDAPAAKPKRKRSHRGGRGRRRHSEDRQNQGDGKQTRQSNQHAGKGQEEGHRRRRRNNDAHKHTQAGNNGDGHAEHRRSERRHHESSGQHPYTERRAEPKQPQRGHHQVATTKQGQSGRRFTIRRLDDKQSK